MYRTCDNCERPWTEGAYVLGCDVCNYVLCDDCFELGVTTGDLNSCDHGDSPDPWLDRIGGGETDASTDS